MNNIGMNTGYWMLDAGRPFYILSSIFFVQYYIS